MPPALSRVGFPTSPVQFSATGSTSTVILPHCPLGLGAGVMKECDLLSDKLLVAAGLPLLFPASHLSTSLQRWPRASPPRSSPLISLGYSWISVFAKRQVDVYLEENSWTQLMRSSLRKYAPLTWPGSVKIRTGKAVAPSTSVLDRTLVILHCLLNSTGSSHRVLLWKEFCSQT